MITTPGFNVLQAIVRSRRTVGWAKMNGAIIPDELVHEILALADWAPTHGRTEPWRFFVYSGEALAEFSRQHAELYKKVAAPENYTDATYERLLHCTDKVSHLVIAAMQRGTNAKIPAWEEMAATSAAVEHILLGATALGISSFWSSGGLTMNPALKDFLHLGAEDQVLGMVFLGYTDEPAKEGSRMIPLSDKVKWH